MTSTLTGYYQGYQAAELPACQLCGGPCLFYAGDHHGYTCRKCLAAYVDGQIAAQDARIAADRATRKVKALTAKLAQRKHNGSGSGSDGEHRGGGDGCGPTATPALTAATTTGGA
jgi:hypothetical protein